MRPTAGLIVPSPCSRIEVAARWTWVYRSSVIESPRARAWIAALRLDARAKHLERAAIFERLVDLGAAFLGRLGDAAEHEHLAAEHARQLARVDRTAAAQHFDRLADLERVADRAADRC